MRRGGSRRLKLPLEPGSFSVPESFMAQQKTYWHLLEQRRMPTEYEIVTSKLLCYTGEGFTGKRFELDVPLLDWYKRFQQDSPLEGVSEKLDKYYRDYLSSMGLQPSISATLLF